MNPHLHKFKFESKSSKGHKHLLAGYTENMIGINAIHFHMYYGICSYSGHTHYFSGLTGLPVKTENGHVHRIEGILEMNSLHDHNYSSYTFEDVEYINDPMPKGSYVL